MSFVGGRERFVRLSEDENEEGTERNFVNLGVAATSQSGIVKLVQSGSATICSRLEYGFAPGEIKFASSDRLQRLSR